MSAFVPPQEKTGTHLRFVREFLAVAETGSVTKAAAALFKAPSAVARSVGELERGLGVSLFERRPRGMVPTAYGEAVRRRALRISDEIDGAVSELNRTGDRRGSADRSALTGLLLNGRGLLLLIALSEMRNLSSAGAALGLSQAGASMALARMETAVSEPLFQRMTRGMVATDVGARLVSRGKRIVAELRHMRSDIAAIEGKLTGLVTIGALPLARTSVIPIAIAAALAKHPNLSIRTIESPYEALAAGLRDGDIDFVVGALRSGDENAGLRTDAQFEDRLGIVVRAEHPLARTRATLADLLGRQWILPRPGAPARRLIEASFLAHDLEPPFPSVETGDLALLRGLLTNTDMLTAISPHQMWFEIEQGRIAEVDVDLGETTRDIGITIREGALLSPAGLAVLDETRAAFLALRASPRARAVR
jgi:LysR family transcriptional regulator, regulator for genes of the gallate degradation pathway